jgi:polysaccharide biosynthesis transport protein
MTLPPASRFKRYATVILRWLLIALVVFVLTFFTGIYITNNILHKVYTATAQMQVLPRVQGGIRAIGNDGTTDKTIDPTAFQAEVEIMESPEVLLPVIKDLGLDEMWAKQVYVADSDQVPDVDALTRLQKMLRIDLVHGTNLINITVSSDVPIEAARIANAVADRYKTMRDAEEDQSNSRGEDSLRDQIAQQQKIVDAAKATVKKMRQDLGRKGDDMPAGVDADAGRQSEDEIVARKRDLHAAQADYDARRVVLESVINLPDDEFIATLKGLGRDPKIVTGPTQPSVKEQVAGLRHSMQIDTDMAKSRVALLQKEVDDLTQMVRQDTMNALVPFRDAQLLDQQQSVLDALTLRLMQVDAEGELQESPVRIISRAQVPEVPTKPNKSFDLIVTILAAGFLSVTVASFNEVMLLLARASERSDN